MKWLGDPWAMFELSKDRQIELLALWRMEHAPRPAPARPPQGSGFDRFRVE